MNYDLTEEELPSDEMLAAANGPTFEDLAIDDSLSDLARVAKYSCSSIALQRVIHVKMLADTARAVGFQQACDVLIPLLEPLVCDVEYVVRQHVALQFPPLCSFLVESDPTDGYRVLLDKMIPLVSKLVSDKQHEVRSAANDSLVAIASLVQPEDQGQYVLTIVLPLAHDDDNEQFRISAISLYHGLAEHLGPELCQQFCVPELISLSEDPVFRVRKSTAQSFSSICKIAGQEISRERLLPAFQRLAHDDIWAVRKACVESLVSISESLALEDRGGLLIPLYESFLSDSSRWVRLAAFQSLGPFLASLERKDVSDEMLQHFTGMATSSASAAQLGGSGEVDMRFHCAYSFPAIVSILGKDEWPKLSSIFDGLSQDSFWKVRRTFAYSLHELARILGPEIAEAQLATAFDAYLKDVPDVKMGAMVHFADFLEQVLPSFRESYLPVLTELLNGLIADQTKWRTREILSLQLPQLCTLFSEESTFSAIYPLAVKLITDDVAVVRHRSVQACPLLIERISNKQEWLDDLLEKVKTLAVSPCFTDRQVFVLISQAMLTAECENVLKLFETDLAPVFFSLASDSVSNVRIVFADMLLTHKDKLLALDSCPEILRGLFAADQPTFSTSEELMTRVGELLPPVKPVGTTSTQAQESTPALDLATEEAITDAGADSGSECIEKAVAPVEVAEVEVEVADASSPST